MEAEAFVLCRTQRGVAMRCACCHQVEITLGNAILCLDPPDLESVLEVIGGFDVDRDAGVCAAERRFIIRTERNEAAFAFSRAEVLELRELVQHARERVRAMDVRPQAAWSQLPGRSVLH